VNREFVRPEVVQARQTGVSVTQPAPRLSILVVADHFSFEGAVYHGVTNYCLTVLPALAAAGVQVTACFLRDREEWLKPLRQAGVEAIGLGLGRWSLSALWQVLRLVRSRRFDLIHAAQLKGSTLALMVGRIERLPVLVHVHDQTVPSPMLRWLNAVAASKRNRCVCVSSAIGTAVTRGYGFDDADCSVLPNAVDVDRFARHRPEREVLRARLLDVHDNRPVIGVVARFFPVKGHAAFIAALPRLLRDHPGTLVVFAGDGPERASCEALATERGIASAIRFLGQRDDMPELLSCLDVVAMPSQSEGLPLAAIEAMAAGVPVVALDVGGMGEVVRHERDGLLAPAGNVIALVALVSRLLDDAAARHRMGLAALGDAGRFSVQEHVLRLRELYQTMVAPGRD